mmetsp:Transcript_15495/g.41615  ORF Transcript_15495/g.41615 Transcript_15495/m.41615 type:complete len:253 (+) Transcript_15495:71-829(+)
MRTLVSVVAFAAFASLCAAQTFDRTGITECLCAEKPASSCDRIELENAGLSTCSVQSAACGGCACDATGDKTCDVTFTSGYRFTDGAPVAPATSAPCEPEDKLFATCTGDRTYGWFLTQAVTQTCNDRCDSIGLIGTGQVCSRGRQVTGGLTEEQTIFVGAILDIQCDTVATDNGNNNKFPAVAIDKSTGQNTTLCYRPTQAFSNCNSSGSVNSPSALYNFQQFCCCSTSDDEAVIARQCPISPDDIFITAL